MSSKKCPINVSNMSLWKLPAKEQATTYLDPLVKMTDTRKLTHHTNWSEVLSKIGTVDCPLSFPDSLTKSQIHPQVGRWIQSLQNKTKNIRTWHFGFPQILSSPFALRIVSFNGLHSSSAELKREFFFKKFKFLKKFFFLNLFFYYYYFQFRDVATLSFTVLVEWDIPTCH